MPVRYAINSFVKARFVGHGGHIQFTTSANMDVALSSFVEASSAAEVNEVDGRDVISTSTFTRVAGGPVARMHLCDSRELLETYLQQVAQALERAGLSGRLAPVKDHDAPRPAVPALTATLQLVVEFERMLAAPHDYQMGPPDIAWWVSPERTARVVPSLIDWCLDVPGRVYFRSGFGTEVAPEDAKQLALDNVLNTHLMLLRVSEDLGSFRRMVLHESGGVFLQIHDVHRTWQDNYEDLQRPLLQAAPDVANAFVRPLPAWLGLRYEAWVQAPATPLCSTHPIGSRMWFLAHLEAEYLPDAYGQQIVTSAHLARLGDLPQQRWDVRPVGVDRYLITARDLKPWSEFDATPFQPDGETATRMSAVPDAATLAQARQDFAGAILNQDVLAAHPSPPITGSSRFD